MPEEQKPQPATSDVEVKLNNASDHAMNQLEHIFDQQRRKAMGDDTSWELVLLKNKNGDSILKLLIKGKKPASP